MRKIFFYLLGLSIVVYLISTCSKTPSDQTQATYNDQQENVSDDSLRAMIDKIPDAPPAIKVFADVPATLGLLSRAGIGPMRSWRNDGMGYMSSTPFVLLITTVLGLSQIRTGWLTIWLFTPNLQTKKRFALSN
jgi:hypothetical protein